MKTNLKDEFTNLYAAIKSINRKVIVIFLSVAVLQTISWYFTSRQFFHSNLYHTLFGENANADLYEFIYWFSGDFLTYFICGILIIKLLLKEYISDYGMNFRNPEFGFKLIAISVIIMLPVVWFVSSSVSFSDAYPMLRQAKESWNKFLIFQVFLFLFIFAWEFFWRGFMLFGLKKEFGYYAVLIQMIPFVILHNGKPVFETFGAIIGALLLGILAYRTGSFLYGVIIHCLVMFMMEFISILRFKTGSYGIGADSFFQIISKMF